MDRRALVLGGGGITGIAWETGLIAGLAGLAIDLAAAGRAQAAAHAAAVRAVWQRPLPGAAT